MQRALSLHQTGHLAQARALYEEILAIQPKHSDAVHLLGVIAHQNKNYQRAADLTGEAIELSPKDATFHYNRGLALQALKQPDDAVASYDYDNAIALKPDFAEACSNRGLALQELAFKTVLSNIPANMPYLKADAEKLLFWREKLGAKNKPRVGLVWSGGFRPNQPELWAVNRRRNIPLAKLAALKNPDIEFYSLQKGEAAEAELAELMRDHWDGPRIIDITDLLDDFSDTAALIENLDLVISVDTSTAHLAGALGKPV